VNDNGIANIHVQTISGWRRKTLTRGVMPFALAAILPEIPKT
jgi:hypothetical protein